MHVERNDFIHAMRTGTPLENHGTNTSARGLMNRGFRLISADRYSIPSSSTSNTSVLFGGIAGVGLCSP